MQEKVDSNIVGLALAEEVSLKTLGASPVFYELEPNAYSNFGADYKTVARNPIKKGRQRRKSVIVDMDGSAAFDMDMTDTLSRRLLQGFMFAKVSQKPCTAPINGTKIVLTAAAVADQSVSAASGLTIFKPGHLVKLTGFGAANNNRVLTVATATATKVTFTGGISNETLTSSAVMEAVGVAAASGDIQMGGDSSGVTLSSTVLDFTTLGLRVGETIFVGGDGTNDFFSLNGRFYGRVSSVAAHIIVMDQVTLSSVVADTGAGKTIKLYFGTTLRNEVDDNLLVRTSYTLERQLGSDVNGTQAEYLKGCVANDFTLNLAEASKVDANLSYVGLSHETRTTLEGPISGTRVSAPNEDAYNTSSNLYQAKLCLADGATQPPLFAHASEVKLSIKNGVKPLKALGVLGGFEAVAATFEVSATMEAYFSAVTPLGYISDNTDVSLSLIATSKNAGFCFDMPLTSLGGGQLKVEKDNPIKLSLNIDAAECSKGYTLFYTNFPYLPSSAMAQQ